MPLRPPVVPKPAILSPESAALITLRAKGARSFKPWRMFPNISPPEKTGTIWLSTVSVAIELTIATSASETPPWMRREAPLRAISK